MDGCDALVYDDLGFVRDPQTPAEWDGWVSGGRLKNFCLKDPVLDWLDRHGRARGYRRDDELPGYDERTDFLRFIGRKGEEFEQGVMGLLGRRYPVRRIATGGWEEVRSLERAEETVAAIADGVPVITQAVLRDPQHRTYGAADLLVRADVLDSLFPELVPAEELAVGSPALGVRWHYRVIDIKYTSLRVYKSGHLSTAKHLAHMAQVATYTAALGRIQGYTPPSAYILGRTQEGVKPRPGCLARLGRADMAYQKEGQPSLAETVASAAAWIRQVRSEGAGWDIRPHPQRDELRPNLKNHKDQPWHAARTQIAAEQREITRLWHVGLPGRVLGLAAGLGGFDDPRATATMLGITGENLVPKLDALIQANCSGGPDVRPARIEAERETWAERRPLEFFVDFETVSSLDDDFSLLPELNGQPAIFMIGCGHIEDGAWRFATFTADNLSLEAERRAIDAWFAHMAEVTARLAPGSRPLVFHWSAAEVSALETAFNSARVRHQDARWPEPNWFDLLSRVVRAEPVTVRGAYGFGLKEVARAFHALGLIGTKWADGPADGLGAMTGAWWCNREAQRQGVSMTELELMHEIARYNEVDCRVMYEVLSYLRANH